MVSFLALLLLASPVPAASFDCAKAARPVEALLCGSPTLSSLDEKMAAAFSSLQASLPDDEKAALLTSQRQWLAYWGRYCSTDGEGTTFDPASAPGCAEREYQARIRDLTPFEVGGHPAIWHTRFSAARPAEDMPDYATLCSHVSRSPFLLPPADPASRPLVDAFNRWIAGLVGGDGAEFADNTTETTLDVTPKLVSPNLVRADTSTYFNGFGAHPTSGSTTSHFFLRQKRPLKASDLLKGQAWKGPVSEAVWTQLNPEMLLIQGPADLVPLLGDPARWTLSPAGLTFTFNVYEVAAYAAGPQDATVSWSMLDRWLTPQGREEIAALAR